MPGKDAVVKMVVEYAMMQLCNCGALFYVIRKRKTALRAMRTPKIGPAQRPRPYTFLAKKPKFDRSYAALRNEVLQGSAHHTGPPMPKASQLHAAKFPKARMPVGGPRP